MRVLPFPPPPSPAGFCAVRTCGVCVRPLLVTATSRKSVACVRYVMCVHRSRQTRKKRTSPPLFSKNALRTHRMNGLGPNVPSSSSSVFTLLSIPPSKYFHVRSTLAFFPLQQPGEEKGKPPLNPHLVHFSGAQVQSYIVGPQKQQWLGLGRTDGLSAAEDRRGGISSHALT